MYRITLRANSSTGKFNRRLLRNVLAVLLDDWSGTQCQIVTPIGEIELTQVQPNRVQMVFDNKVKMYSVN